MLNTCKSQTDVPSEPKIRFDDKVRKKKSTLLLKFFVSHLTIKDRSQKNHKKR